MLKVQDRKFQKQLQTTEDSSCLKTEVSEVNLPETSKRERGGKDAARARKRTVAHHLWARFYKGSSLKWDAAYQTKAHLYLYARVPGCALLTKQKLNWKRIYIYKHSSKYIYIKMTTWIRHGEMHIVKVLAQLTSLKIHTVTFFSPLGNWGVGTLSCYA